MAISRFLTRQLEKMDKAAKKMAGSPGYDDDTMAAQKEYAREQKIEKSKKLSKEEEAAADKEAYASAMGKGKSTPKGKLTEKEKKQLQEEINMSKGGMSKKKPMKYNKGGMVMANCGASMKPTQKAKK
jgi:hypothetical protein